MSKPLVRVVLSSNQHIYGASKQQLENLRTKLTFDNPRYAAAAKFSRWGPPVTIPRYLTFYDYDAKTNCMEVPLHFPLPFKPDSVSDERCKVKASWPKLRVKLRAGQKKALVSYLKNPENGQVVLDTGEGKCCNYNTLISTDLGFLKLKELTASRIKDSISPLCLKVDTSEGVRQTSAVYYGGLSKTKKITTKFGYRVECTPEHKLLTFVGGKYEWKRSDEITTDDYIVLKRSFDWTGKYQTVKVSPASPQCTNVCLVDEVKLDEELAFILGLLTAEGTLNRKSTVTFSNSNKRLVGLFKKHIENLGLKIRHYCGYDYVVHSVHYRQILSDFGLLLAKSKDKEVPYSVRVSPKNVVISFIKGYMESECNITESSIEVTSKSHKLLAQIQTILLALGLLSSLKEREVAYYGTYYRLTIHDVLKYKEIFGEFVTREQQRKFSRLVSIKERTVRNTNIDIIPGLHTLLKKLEIELKSQTTSYQRGKLRTYANGYRNCSYAMLRQFIDFGKEYLENSPTIEELERIYANNYVYLQVETIRDSLACVMDLTVDDNHNYVGNGIVCHNTILAFAIAATLKQKTLVLVDRVAYTKPWYDDFEKVFGLSKSEIGLIRGNEFRIGKRVTVAFFQTLNNRDLSRIANEFGLIIHDESDTAAAPTRFAVVSSFNAKYRLAISGTTKRTDGLEFLHKFLFGDFAVNLQGQGKNILSSDDVLIRRVETGFNCRVPMRWSQSTIEDEEIPSEGLITDHNKLWAMEARDPKSNALKLYIIEKALKNGEVCLVLTHRVFHANLIGQELIDRGYKCKILYGETPQHEKDLIIDELNSGKIQCIISTFSYIKRGANMPRLTRGFALTQTANETELRQAIGRIRRANTEIHVARRKGKVIRVYKKPKAVCVWYDFTCKSIKPYRYQAAKRLKLWNDMGFRVEEVTVPI